jgi:hypothetical protein
MKEIISHAGNADQNIKRVDYMSDHQESDRIQTAAEEIDALLGQDDGALLAVLARYRVNLIECFDRGTLVELLRAAVDKAPCVSYYSNRSRRSIDPARPSVDLLVDDAAALKCHPKIALELKQKGLQKDELGYGITKEEYDRIARFKTAVVYAEVCQPLVTEMNAALTTNWPKAQARLVAAGTKLEMARLLLTNLFTVRVNNDVNIPSPRKMTQLGLFI